MAESTNSNGSDEENNTGIFVDCFLCGSDIRVAIWDDAALSGNLAMYCQDCRPDDRPESNLWEAEREDESHPVVDIPSLPDHKDWEVLDHHRNWKDDVLDKYDVDTKEELREELDEADFVDHAADDILEKPEDNSWEIVVHDLSDEQAIEEAREEIRRR